MKKILVAAGIVVVIVGAVWTWLALRTVPPPDVDSADSAKITAYIASEDFAKLAQGQKAEFMGKVRDLPDDKRQEVFRAEGADDKTRQALRQNMRGSMQARMAEEAKEFFKLSAEEQAAALDKRIDEMEARRKEMEDRRAAGGGTQNGNGGPGGPGRTRDPDVIEKRMQQHIEESTPEDRAYMAEYWREMRARMQQRGITGGGPGRRG